MYVMDKLGKWDYYLHLVEFAYNNHFQVSARMSPFETFYGRKCNTPIFWSSLVNMLMLGHELLKDMELTMKHVQKKLKFSQDRKKLYVDLKKKSSRVSGRRTCIHNVKTQKNLHKTGKIFKIGTQVLQAI